MKLFWNTLSVLELKVTNLTETKEKLITLTSDEVGILLVLETMRLKFDGSVEIHKCLTKKLSRYLE